MAARRPVFVQVVAQNTSGGRIDAESSMLTSEEKIYAKEAHKRIYDRYHKTFKEKGGTKKILAEMVAYLVSECGDPLAGNPKDASHRQGLDAPRTALRALLDPAFAGNPEGTAQSATYDNLLDPSNSSTDDFIPVIEGVPRMSYRDFLAYRWLAATDPDMPITESNLKIAIGETLEEKRSSLITAEKNNLIDKIAEIRRAHNGDAGFYPKDSMVDEPSCPTGTFGRFAAAPVFSKIAKMQVNPLKFFVLNVEALIAKEFKEADQDVRDGYQFLVSKNFLYLDPEENEDTKRQVKAYLSFVGNVKSLEGRIINELSDEIPDGSMTLEQRDYAEKEFRKISGSLDISLGTDNPEGNISDTMSEKMNSIVNDFKKEKVKKSVIAKMEEQYKTGFEKLSVDLENLILEVRKIDLKALSNKDIIRVEANILKKEVGIISRKRDCEENVLEEAQKSYEEGLQEEEFDGKYNINEISFKGSESIREDKEKFNKIRQEYDDLLSNFVEAQKKEISERVYRLGEEFILEKKQEVEEIKSECIALEKKFSQANDKVKESIKNVNENLVVPGMIDYELESVKLSRAIMDLNFSAREKFLNFCDLKGLSLSRAELDDVVINVKETTSLSFSVIDSVNKNILNIGIQDPKVVKDLEDFNENILEAEKVTNVHDKYQEFLEKAMHETAKITLDVYYKINAEILNIEDSKPKKDSLPHKQLAVLRKARESLKAHVEHLPRIKEYKEQDINEIIEKEDSVHQILRNMHQDLNKVGYDGKFKEVLKNAEHKLKAIMNWTFKLDLKVSKSLKKHDIQEILKFSESLEMSKIKLEKEIIKKPEYANRKKT